MTIRREQFTNAVETTLNGGINNSTTTVVVTDGSTFPVSFFRIKIDDEIMYVTSKSSNTFTVIRAYEGTTAASHADLVEVNHCVTAGSLQAFRRILMADASFVPEDESASSDDDEFDDETFSGWTSIQGTPTMTVTERNHRLSILLPTGTASAQHYGIVKAKTPGAGNYVQCGVQHGGSGSQFPIFGLVMSNSGTYNTGRQVQFTFSTNENQFFQRETTNWNTNQGQNGGGGESPHFFTVLHLRLTWNSSNNYTMQCSPDAISWATVFSGSYGSVGTPTHVGMIVTSWGSNTPQVYSYTYCRFNW